MYEDFFKWIDETEKIRKIYNDFSNTYGIEAEQFLPTKSRLFIVPTEKIKISFLWILPEITEKKAYDSLDATPI